MAVKSFIRGDFRTLIVDNDYPTNYKVYYNGRWNYIQDEESFIKRLNPDLGESYLNRFNLKVLDNNQWIRLAILDNYYNKNEKRNSIFYRTITRENFNFKPRAVNFTEMDARLGLNNLQDSFISNEAKYNKKEIEEITDRIGKDEILYKLGNVNIYNELNIINYKLSEKDNFENNTNINFLEDKTELDYYYNTQETEVLELNNSNTFEISDKLEINDKCVTFKKILSNTKKVKEVLINNWRGSASRWCYNTTDFYDENFELIKCGNVISNGLYSAETDNFLIETNSVYDGSYLPLYAFNNNSGSQYCSGDTSNTTTANVYLKLTFKTPRYITKINTSIIYWSSCKNICDINLIYEDDTTDTYTVTSTYNGEVITFDELFEMYEIHEIQSLKITINNFKNFDVESFNKLNLFGSNISKNDCTLKFAIKFDNNDYHTFKDKQWNSIAENKTDILNDGMTLEEFASISKEDIINYFGNVQTCDIFISILNNNKMYNIPELYSIIKIFNSKIKNNTCLVDEIYFDNFVSWKQNGDCGGRYLFYNEDGNLIESGSVITDGLTYAESENFIMEAYSAWDNSYKVSNAFRTDDSKNITRSYGFCFGSFSNPVDNTKLFLRLKFKTPQCISKILCNPSHGNIATYNCDIHLKLNEQEIKKYTIHSENYNQLTTLENLNDICYYDDSIGIVKTNTNQIQNIDKIEKIQIIADELKDTKVKIALSVDSKNTYLKFDGTNWNINQENDIINDGNTIDEINNLTYQDFFNLDLTNKTLDFIICMETSDVAVTPNIKKIIVTSIDKK